MLEDFRVEPLGGEIMEKIHSSWWDEEEELDLSEDSIYSEEYRGDLLEDDEISSEEAAFMKGWEEAM